MLMTVSVVKKPIEIL